MPFLQSRCETASLLEVNIENGDQNKLRLIKIFLQYLKKMNLFQLHYLLVLLINIWKLTNSMKCWQCAAVEGKKCPEDAKTVSSEGKKGFWLCL